jgi:hypothetical protein
LPDPLGGSKAHPILAKSATAGNNERIQFNVITGVVGRTHRYTRARDEIPRAQADDADGVRDWISSAAGRRREDIRAEGVRRAYQVERLYPVKRQESNSSLNLHAGTLLPGTRGSNDNKPTISAIRWASRTLARVTRRNRIVGRDSHDTRKNGRKPWGVGRVNSVAARGQSRRRSSCSICDSAARRHPDHMTRKTRPTEISPRISRSLNLDHESGPRYRCIARPCAYAARIAGRSAASVRAARLARLSPAAMLQRDHITASGRSMIRLATAPRSAAAQPPFRPISARSLLAPIPGGG